MEAFLLIVWIAIHLLLLVYLVYLVIRLLPLVLYARQPLPFIPINRRVAKTIARLPELSDVKKIVDLGCGTGTLLAEVSKEHRDADITGIDYNRTVLGIAKYRSRFWRKKPTWILGDMFTFPVNAYDAIIGWWVPGFASRLLPKLAAECRPGCVVVSYMFSLPEHSAFECRTLKCGKDSIHIYRRRAFSI